MSKQLEILLHVDKSIESVKKKMQKHMGRIYQRQEDSRKQFPGKTVLEIETIENWVDMAALAGELKALKRIKKML